MGILRSGTSVVWVLGIFGVAFSDTFFGSSSSLRVPDLSSGWVSSNSDWVVFRFSGGALRWFRWS